MEGHARAGRLNLTYVVDVPRAGSGFAFKPGELQCFSPEPGAARGERLTLTARTVIY